MKSFLTGCLILLSLLAEAQIEYAVGYFIDNDNKRVECLINDKGWRNNPEKFEYKEAVDGAVKEVGVQSVKEFGVSGSRFIRATVKIDMSTRDYAKLSTNKNPEWEEKTVFLRLVEEGPGTLYIYNEPMLERFFFSVNDSPIEQLVYKLYAIDTQTAARLNETAPVFGTNKMYLNQLQLKMNCEGKGYTSAFMKMKYQEDPLRKFFRAYNICSGFTPPKPAASRNKMGVNIKVAPGMDFTSLVLVDAYTNKDKGSASGSTIRMGIEAEFIMPFGRNKWGAVIEPAYQRFSNDDKNVKINYTSIETLVAVRHYFFLGESSRIFLNAGIVFDFPFGDRYLNKLELKSTANGGFGLGYQFKNFTIEARQYTRRELLNINQIDNTVSDYHKTSIILGYKIQLTKTRSKSGADN